MTAASTPKGERRRHQLIVAAAGLLAEGGFDAVRHRAVAERAGLPLASTTYYFASLDELVEAAVEYASKTELTEARAKLGDLAAEHMTADVAADLMLDLLLGSESRDGLDAVLLRYEQLVAYGRRPYLGPLMRGLRRELDALLTDILARCGVAVTPEQLYRIVAVVDGAVVSALIESDPDPRAHAKRMLLSQLPD